MSVGSFFENVLFQTFSVSLQEKLLIMGTLCAISANNQQGFAEKANIARPGFRHVEHVERHVEKLDVSDPPSPRL